MPGLSGVKNMASSSSSMKHDVFLSFRGEDTRAKFTSHLHKKLCDKSIETYIDNRLERGDNISSSLLEAIRSSKISVIILSENYATSSWCLDEVLCILECKELRGQVVVPVFYEVDPSTVRNQCGSYAAAFAQLQLRFEGKRVDQWRAALTQVANVSGFHSSQYRTESDFVDAIVKDVIKKLNDMSSNDDFEGLVGIHESVEEVEKLLCIDSTDAWMIGIWGMGGVGKTTLARVVFKRISSLFDGHCFLQNVREESKSLGGLETLKKKLFSVLLAESISDIEDFHKDRLRRKKVLIVLDDVDQPETLEDLAGDQEWFGLGSKVIITTRNDQVLRNRADGKYELKGLNSECALELFHLNAFKKNCSKTEDDMKLSQQAIIYADGLPLALKVLGSFLRSRRRENWEIELERLEKVPNKLVQNVLKISYDSMDEQEQKVFLDIVCFVEVGERTCRHYIERKLGGESLKIEIDSLIDMSLIVVEDGYLRMHDLVRDMGWEFVRQQSIEEPGKRSRLVHVEDCYRVLENNTGTITVQGISLRGSYKSVNSSPQVFNQMHRLWFLQIKDDEVEFTQELHYLPCALKYLEWDFWQFKSLPENFKAQNLVELRITDSSSLERLWSGEQDLPNLKYVDLRSNYNLTNVSALSWAPNLECVDISYCKSLCEVPSLRFGDIGKIYHECYDYKCSTLGHLRILWCKNLEVLSGISGNVKALKLTWCSIEELPTSIASLQNLECLILKECRYFKKLPRNMQNLHSLKCLELSRCSSFETLPLLPRNLTQLTLNWSAIEQVPSETLECLNRLEELDLSFCKRLKNLPTCIHKLKALKHLNLEGCERFRNFPEILEPMECLEVLNLEGTSIEGLPSYVENLTSILETGIQQLRNLKHLTIRSCTSLKSLSALPLSLELVHASGRFSLNTISNSRDLLQQEQWTNYDVTSRRRFIFYQCPLDQNTRTRMTKEFQLRVLHTAATIVLNNVKIVGDPDIGICFPDNQIPRWFTNYSHTSIMNVSLPLNWHNNNFLGFALCTVVDMANHYGELDFCCDLDFKSESGRTICNYQWFLGKGIYRSSGGGSQMFMWYKHENYHKCRDSATILHTSFRMVIDDRYFGTVSCNVRAWGFAFYISKITKMNSEHQIQMLLSFHRGWDTVSEDLFYILKLLDCYISNCTCQPQSYK